MRRINLKFLIVLFMASFTTANAADDINKIGGYSLTVKVEKLRNSKGVIQFSLYDKDGTIPDKKHTKYFKQLIGEIRSSSSVVTLYRVTCWALCRKYSA